MKHLEKRIKTFEAQRAALKIRKLEILRNTVPFAPLSESDKKEMIDITTKINDIGLMIYEITRQLQYYPKH